MAFSGCLIAANGKGPKRVRLRVHRWCPQAPPLKGSIRVVLVYVVAPQGWVQVHAPRPFRLVPAGMTTCSPFFPVTVSSNIVSRKVPLGTGASTQCFGEDAGHKLELHEILIDDLAAVDTVKPRVILVGKAFDAACGPSQTSSTSSCWPSCRGLRRGRSRRVSVCFVLATPLTASVIDWMREVSGPLTRPMPGGLLAPT